jgi:DNA recombination protein RmuC
MHWKAAGWNSPKQSKPVRANPRILHHKEHMDPIIVISALVAILAAVAGYLAGALGGRARATAAETRAERLPLVEGRLQEAEQQLGILNTQIATLTTQLTQERSQNAEKIALLQSARDELTHQFKSLANDILEEKSKRFSEQNQQSLGQLLEPLKSRLQEFQGKVEQVYVQEGKDRSALAEQVRQLMELNRTVSQEANNLTKALKGSNKAQGNWGELILERVLETAGLRKGEEYDVQESHTTGDGKRLQPDVVLHLPEDRHLVIDAKATLVAYEDYANAEDEKHREAALKRHLDAVRTHIKGLSDKNYQDLYGLKSLDFVLMFIPIEPAFMLAVTHDRELFMDAWNKNVLLVSPSTLLFVVRTVASLWRQEAQNRNAQEIAKRGAELYDKLAGFVEDMESLGNRLSQAQKDYDGAINKLSSGKGNVIRQAEMLRKLGVKPNKSLPAGMVDNALDAADME